MIICTMQTPEIKPYTDWFLANKIDYANHWGHDFHLLNRNLCHDLPPAFSKVLLLRQLLENHEIVMWIDMDAAFMNFTIDMSTVIHQGSWIVALEESPWYVCTGVMLLRRCDESFDMLEVVQNEIDDNPHKEHPWEQHHINKYLCSLELNEGIQYESADVIGGFGDSDNSLKHPYKPGYPIYHLPGIPWVDRDLYFKGMQSQIVR